MPDSGADSRRATYEVAVVGGGVIGMSVAYGLARLGRRTVVFDGGDTAFRASRGNAGLVWVQGKGSKCPPYALWSLGSADRWALFGAQLRRETNVDVEYERPGGFLLFDRQDEWDEELAGLAILKASDPVLDYEVLDPAALARRVPAASRDLLGGTFSRHDGQSNPLALLRALQAAFQRAGGTYCPHRPVRAIDPHSGHFQVETADGITEAGQVVLGAGLGNIPLAPMVGLRAPVAPLRGQMLVTEKLEPFLGCLVDGIRQTVSGSVVLGSSSEPVGLDDGVTAPILATIARFAITRFPRLRRARVLRAWASLRIMTPDGMPVYEPSPSCPGAFLVNSHSGVTLAAAHAEVLAPWIAGQAAPDFLEYRHASRFSV